ncbi:MAG: YjjG family noncanonical pyrimidine nucleotidase [Eubacterium sp.]|nr:YjjG family noncanonical pyrimidine nucleotidase [Eubacterium sp.]
MIKNILFDLDDTIFDFKMAERVALSKTLVSFGIEPTEYIIKRYSELNISQWKLLELGKLTREQVKVNRYKLLFDELGLDISPQKATAIYEDNLCIGHYFMDGAEELIKTLCDKGYDLYLVSNGAKRVQDGRLKSSGISKYFKGIFISEVVGYEKPNIEFFNCCFERIENFNREETIIVGDSLSSDIKGGINAGIKTVWFNPNHEINTAQLIPTYEINKLSDIIKYI